MHADDVVAAPTATHQAAERQSTPPSPAPIVPAGSGSTERDHPPPVDRSTTALVIDPVDGTSLPTMTQSVSTHETEPRSNSKVPAGTGRTVARHAPPASVATNGRSSAAVFS